MTDIVAAVIFKFARHGGLVKRVEVEQWFALAQAREELSAIGGGPDWLELSDEDRISCVIDARAWLQAARNVGLAGAVAATSPGCG